MNSSFHITEASFYAIIFHRSMLALPNPCYSYVVKNILQPAKRIKYHKKTPKVANDSSYGQKNIQFLR